jgi:hypothetical protein
MPNELMRLTVFVAVAFALLCAGWAYHQQQMPLTFYFMTCAIALTVMTHVSVKRQII